jgi:DNA-binding cell septation regulator SpoVG
VLGGAALLALGGQAISEAVTGVMDDIKNQRVEELEEEMDEMYDGMEDELDDVLSEYDEDDPQKEMFEALMGEAKGKLNSQGSIIESTPGGIYYFDAFHGSSWNPHDVFDKTLELIEEKHTQFGFSEKDIELMEEEKDLFQNMFSRSTAEEKFTNEDREISNELKDIQNKINKVLESQREFTQEVVEKANTQYANSLEPSEGEKYNDMVTKMEKFRELDPHLQMTDDLIEIFDKDIRENVNTQSEIGSKMHEEVGAEIRESQDRAKEIGAEVGKLTEKWYDLAEKKDLNLAEMKSLQNKMDAITREVAREAEDESEYKKLNEYVRKYEKNLDTYNKEIGKLDDEIIARNEQISKLVDEIEKVDDKSKIQKMNEIQSLESKNQKSIESRTDLVDKREDMNSKREDYAARKEEITQKYYEDLHDDEKEAFEKLKKEYDSLQEKDTKFKSEMEKNQKDRDDLDNESAENEKKGQKKLKEFHKLEDEYANYGDLEEESRNLRLDIRKDVGDYSKEVSNLLKKANMAKFSKEDKMNINMIVGLVQEKLKEKIKDLKKNPPKSNTTNKKAKEKKSLDKDKLVATIQKNLIKNLKAMKK